MTLDEMLDEFRSQVADEAIPYLWSDDEVLRYVIDAQDMYARKTGGIADMSTAAIVNLAVVQNTPFSAHSPYILRIMSGALQTSQRDVQFVHESQIGTLRQLDYGTYTSFNMDDTDVGEVRYGVLGLTDNSIRWLRVPEVSEVIRLRVYRLPYPRIVDWNSSLEIGTQHHRHLILWMKYLAYAKQDAEARNDKISIESRAMFMEYCTESRNEIDRVRYKPRTVKFSW